MTEWEVFAILVVGLGLAALSLRTLGKTPKEDRAWYGCVLLSMALLGAIIAGPGSALFSADGVQDESYWPLGLVAGLAVVELGPPLLRTVKALFQVVVGVIKSRLGGGS